jgi:hypothetical protein
MQGLEEYIIDLLSNDKKFIIFAHHSDILK